MRLGFALPTSGPWASPENQVRVAQEAEQLGYASLWAPQRLLYALEPKNGFHGVPGQAWPPSMRRVVDPIVTLAYVAAVTSRVRLGTSVLCMPYFSPILLARQLASLDQVCGGRLDVGLGLGWSEDEYEASNVPFGQRGRRGDEFIRCLKAIWTDEVVEFKGDFYRVPKSLVEPKPLQRPHPPILIGGYGPAATRWAALLGDGFTGGSRPLAELEPQLASLRSAAEAAGRDPTSLRIVCRGTLRVFDSPQGADRRPLFGTLDEIRADLERYAAAGLTELFLDANAMLGDPSEEPDAARCLERGLE